ncbi:DUF202 domain-containing protein [Stutzerimonas nitrititolerans]|uniref:DUF202 domain-containing protein n=1 Tax=Stutzerimonas nitrititolerans TaxID=2482751 RepID=UPI002899E037|nr:DUF202 domain-containing protein [Stutzerimonas nitrititolerans]
MRRSFRRRRQPEPSPLPLHADPGLQPERSSLAWGRTLLTLISVSALFLRWMPYHGAFVGTLLSISLLTAGAIWLTQRRRYLRSASGLETGRIRADLASVMWLSTAVCVLGALGLYTVIYLPIH